jgi:hypothetical protein
MMQYATFAEHTQNRRASEVKDALRFFFTDSEIDQAVAVLTGCAPTLETKVECDCDNKDPVHCRHWRVSSAGCLCVCHGQG